MNCIVVEDEIPAQIILKNFLGKLPHLEVCGIFKSAIEAHSFLKHHTVDLVFLDINLPDISGIDFIKTIQNPPAIIITTAYPDYAVCSFELDTIVDYLVKPFAFDRFLKALTKAEQFIKSSTDIANNSTPESIFLNVDKTHHRIIINHILVIESNRNYVSVVTKTQTLTYIESLKNWKEKVPESDFIQIHKSFIINTNYVEKIAGNEVYVAGKRLPIGRSYRRELMLKLKIN